ncbi:MAG: F420-0--gamma-glutamyl ligase, partial [Clostridiales bacterium]|nr:F420-0--gamma-glutamyl ligase [Clostridiales bacterium]
TKGLIGTPNELKLKYVADENFGGLSSEDKETAIKKLIEEKGTGDTSFAEGTTPRRYYDLLGSLCDLTSGSGDKGTPVVLIQGYFDNYADQ